MGIAGTVAADPVESRRMPPRDEVTEVSAGRSVVLALPFW
jgi:hypothetical protein